jgi:uncharacterized protein YjbI with pentapeptide repeats
LDLFAKRLWNKITLWHQLKNIMMLNPNSIGNKIATAWKNVNLSQAELAKQVSISPQAVGKWERGESMPNITTLNRIAEILDVDLNYFSESFQTVEVEHVTVETEKKLNALPTSAIGKKNNWDMSKLNLADSDFSGLKNLHEKFSSSNMQRCLFIGSDLSELILKKNNVDGCDFSNSDLSKSQIQDSMLNKNSFKNCILKETEFHKTFLYGCDLSGADLTKATFKESFITKSKMENVILKDSSFIGTGFQEINFEGAITDCSFENCVFHKVKFQNATLTNTFFKNNKKFNRVKFIDCNADKLTYAFLKSNLADLSGLTLLP